MTSPPLAFLLSATLALSSTLPTTFAYDALSRRTQRTLENSTQAQYAYDAANRLLELTHVQLPYAFVWREPRTWPRALASVFSLNLEPWALNLVAEAAPTARPKPLPPETLSQLTYTYDNVGNRLSAVHSQQTTVDSFTYGYDPLSQLTTVTGTQSHTYQYDPVGNRQLADGTSYSPNPLNQYSQVGSTSYTYDANGNLTFDGVNTYSYDAENRLVSSSAVGSSATYTYDAFGRRISKTVNATTTKFTWDGDQLIEELDGAGSQLAEYINGPGIDEPLRMQRGTTKSYYLQDGLGSIIALTTSQGQISESYTYDPYGQPTILDATGAPIGQSALGNRYLFTGREYDSETGLYYNRARYWSSSIGRFLSRDPLGFLPDINLYRYVGSVGKGLPYFKPVNETNAYLYAGNNPITRIDPLGLWYIDVNVGGGWWGGVGTGGLIFSDKGIYWYGGGGVGIPGFSGALTWSPFDPTPGWNFGLQAGGLFKVFGGQAGKDLQGNPFWEVGLVSPGLAGTAYYVHEIWTPPTPVKKGCQP